MTIAVRMLSALVVCLGVAVLASSEEKDKPKAKETTLKGTILCTKCELGETDDCGNAIKVKAGD